MSEDYSYDTETPSFDNEASTLERFHCGPNPRRIKASPETLMEQAGWSAHFWMRQAQAYIDQEFGKGFARQNPGLVGQFMLSAGLDMLGTSIISAAQIHAEDSKREPNYEMNEAITDVAKSLDSIAQHGINVSEG